MLHHLVKCRFQLIDTTEFLQKILQRQEKLIGLCHARLLAREELLPTPPLPPLALVLFLVLVESVTVSEKDGSKTCLGDGVWVVHRALGKKCDVVFALGLKDVVGQRHNLDARDEEACFLLHLVLGAFQRRLAMLQVSAWELPRS